jgi:hypothetical protein
LYNIFIDKEAIALFNSGILSNPNFLGAMVIVATVIIGITAYWLLKCFTKLSRKRRCGFTTAIAVAPFSFLVVILGYLEIQRFSWGFIVIILVPVIAYFTVQPAVRNDA